MRKAEDSNLIATNARTLLNEKYLYHLKVYTDGSVLGTGKTGAGCVIPDLNMKRSFFLGKGFSIFTAELVAIIMALNTINSMSIPFYSLLFCVDSQSVINSLQSNISKERPELIYDIKHSIHSLIVNGTSVDFLWIPSHSGLLYNDWADKAAKQGLSLIHI